MAGIEMTEAERHVRTPPAGEFRMVSRNPRDKDQPTIIGNFTTVAAARLYHETEPPHLREGLTIYDDQGNEVPL